MKYDGAFFVFAAVEGEAFESKEEAEKWADYYASEIRGKSFVVCKFLSEAFEKKAEEK